MSKIIETFGEFCEALAKGEELEFLFNEEWHKTKIKNDRAMSLSYLQSTFEMNKYRIKPGTKMIEKGRVVYEDTILGRILITAADIPFTRKEFEKGNEANIFIGFVQDSIETIEEEVE